MTNLYPIKFKPILKERVWGGVSLVKYLNKKTSGSKPIGESWEISGVQGDVSVASTGFLKGNDINEVIETYLGEFVGDAIYEKFGNEFPILIKFLDIQDNLSLQVHPNDEVAIERHNSYGKTEFWYILDADPGAKIYMGFNNDTTAIELYDKCNNDTVTELLNVVNPKKGDYFFIEPGTLHAATGGILVAEIQQVSDITYRVYDWGREHNPATARDMHLDLAIDCINYEKYESKGVKPANSEKDEKEREILVDCNYFKIEKINLAKTQRLDSQDFNSFVIYICSEGKARINGNGVSENIIKGETILVPAYMGEYTIEKVSDKCQLIEVTGKY
ncbi:MAG: type I phosphomannose isomerase catalytic subunit [Bacteroidales bacterium]|jgi:mannose-6-phosphate isomerase